MDRPDRFSAGVGAFGTADVPTHVLLVVAGILVYVGSSAPARARPRAAPAG